MLQKIKKLYHQSPVRPRFAKKAAVFLLDLFASALSFFKGIRFPEKYDWEMKLKFLLGLYESETALFCKKIIKPGMKVIDIGAHIGYFSILFSKLVGKNGVVFAFEPEPSNLALLKQNTKRYANIEIIDKAVSNKAGSIDFHISPGKTGCHSVVPADFRGQTITVSAVSLDSWLCSRGFPEIGLIKMDVEGGEPSVILGAEKFFRQKNDIMLITEFSPENLIISGVEPRRFLENIWQLGFEIFIANNNGQAEKISPADYGKINALISAKKDAPDGGEETYVNLFCIKKEII